MKVWECFGIGAGFGELEGKVQNINLSVEEGERIALLGLERSGRSMMLRVLAGLRPVRQGQMKVFGEDVVKLAWYDDWDNIFSRNMRRRIGVSLEAEGMLSNVTVREGLETLFRFKYGDHNEKLVKGSKQVVAALVEKFGIVNAVDKRPYLLTAAERRLASLARAFLVKPSVVMLENPSQNVGDLQRGRLWKALEMIIEQRERTVVMSTDDWAIAHHFCRRWIVMQDGIVAFDGVPADFIKSGHSLVASYRSYLDVRDYDRRVVEVAA